MASKRRRARKSQRRSARREPVPLPVDQPGTAPVRCARATSRHCLRAVLVPVVELQGDGHGDPAILTVLPVPDHFIGDPDDDGDGVICEACATPDELAEWQAGLAALAEQHEREDRRLPLSEEELEAHRVFGVEPRDPDDYGSLA